MHFFLLYIISKHQLFDGSCSRNFLELISKMVGCPSPVVESPSEPGSLISRWLRACENAYFATSVKSQRNTAILIVSLVGNAIRLFTTNYLEAIGACEKYFILISKLWETSINQKMWVFLSRSLRGSSEPASQACGLTWILRPTNHTFQRTQDPLAPWRVRPLSLIQVVIAHVARALRRLHP